MKMLKMPRSRDKSRSIGISLPVLCAVEITLRVTSPMTPHDMGKRRMRRVAFWPPGKQHPGGRRPREREGAEYMSRAYLEIRTIEFLFVYALEFQLSIPTGMQQTHTHTHTYIHTHTRAHTCN